MDLIQAFIIATGLAGHFLVARRRPLGYWFWIAGNLALIALFGARHLYGMVALYVIYTAISLYAIRSWRSAGAFPAARGAQP